MLYHKIIERIEFVHDDIAINISYELCLKFLDSEIMIAEN